MDTSGGEWKSVDAGTGCRCSVGDGVCGEGRWAGGAGGVGKGVDKKWKRVLGKKSPTLLLRYGTLAR